MPEQAGKKTCEKCDSRFIVLSLYGLELCGPCAFRTYKPGAPHNLAKIYDIKKHRVKKNKKDF